MGAGASSPDHNVIVRVHCCQEFMQVGARQLMRLLCMSSCKVGMPAKKIYHITSSGI